LFSKVSSKSVATVNTFAVATPPKVTVHLLSISASFHATLTFKSAIATAPSPQVSATVKYRLSRSTVESSFDGATSNFARVTLESFKITELLA
jgi:hypothetical protein